MTYTLQSSDEKKQFYYKVFALVVPMALQNLINAGVNTSDVIMLGKVSETVLSAASLAGQIQFILILIIFGLTSGAAVLTAQYWGKRDIKAIQSVMGIAFRFALIISVIFTLAAFFFPNSLMRLFTNDELVIKEGIKFMRIISLSYVFSSLTMTYLNIMRSVERVVVSTIVYSISLAINIILNAIFIFGLLGCPKMGIAGSALGTLCARIVEFTITFIYAKLINHDVPLSFSNLVKHDKLLFKDFLVYCVPVLFNELFWGLGISTNTAIIGHMGSSAVAANSIAQVTRQLAMIVCFGIANATAILVGKAIGENSFERAKLYAKRCLRLSILFGIIGSLIIILSRPIIINNLNITQDAARYLNFMLFVMAYFVIAQSLTCTMIVGVLRGGGDTKYGLVIDISTMWCFSIVLGIVAAFVFNLSVPIVYVIIMSDEIIKIPLCIWRYRTFKWLKNVTR